MSNIDYSRLRSLTARRLVQALLDEGFFLVRQRGSHRRYANSDGRRVTVPFTRSGDTFAPGTLRSMIETQAHWSAQDLERLRLL
ncbi:MAG: hypothetical protein BZY83_03190 [SAR202 cluster bacterium Casp-Chloro-G2]|nr:MAG: hypothetical protein BZY83_03190 [SAR202 cluster bacterium Casp-Chloro-G2]